MEVRLWLEISMQTQYYSNMTLTETSTKKLNESHSNSLKCTMGVVE